MNTGPSGDLGKFHGEARPFLSSGSMLRILASEIDGEPDTLRQYRTVAAGWPDGTRVPSATWAAHRALMGPPSDAPARRKLLESLPRNEHSHREAWPVFTGRTTLPGNPYHRHSYSLARGATVIGTHEQANRGVLVIVVVTRVRTPLRG